TRYCAAAHKHWLKCRDWRKNPGASDLNDDLIQAGLDAFCRVFVRDCPAWRFRGEPEPLALRELIDFDDCAVGLVGNITPDLVELADCIENLVDRIGQPPIFVGWQTEFLEQPKNLRVEIDVRSLNCAHSVKNDSKLA